MNNCLVSTQIEESPNKNLPVLGEIGMWFNIPSRTIVTLMGSTHSGTYNVRVDEDEPIYISTSNEETPSDKEITNIAGTGSSNYFYAYNDSDSPRKFCFYFSSKYNFVELICNSSSANAGTLLFTDGYKGIEPEYIPYVTSVKSSSNNLGVAGDIRNLNKLKDTITYLKYRADLLTEEIDVKHFAFTKVTDINFLSSTMIVGDIQGLGSCLAATNIAFGHSKCSGTVESLIKKMVSLGKTSGSFTCSSTNNSDVTFNGSKSNAISGVSWVPNSIDATKTDITMNGITVTV